LFVWLCILYSDGKTLLFSSLQGVKTVERTVLEIKKIKTNNGKESEKYTLLAEGLVHPLYFVMYF